MKRGAGKADPKGVSGRHSEQDQRQEAVARSPGVLE